jgi:hypothetical protein
MSPTDEYLDLMNDDDEVIGRKLRSEVYAGQPSLALPTGTGARRICRDWSAGSIRLDLTVVFEA